MQKHTNFFGSLAALAMTFFSAACVGGTAIDLAQLVISPDSATIEVGSTRTFTATAVFTDESTDDYTDVVEWTTTDAAIAEFDAAAPGTLVAKAPGSVKVRVTDLASGIEAEVSVTVTEASLQSVEVVLDPAAVAAGLSADARAFAVYSDGARSDVTLDAKWSSSDEAVATVANDGRVTGVAAGEAQITASFEGMSASTTVTVTEAELASVEIEAASSVALGLKIDARLFATYTDGTRTDVTEFATWTSSDEAIATVSNANVTRGSVTGVAMGGPVTISAEFEGMTADAQVIVTEAVLVAIHSTGPATTMLPGQTMQLTATGTYSDGRVEDVTHLVTWYTSDYTVATVNTGLVTSHAAGFTSIEALDPATGLSCTYQITVQSTL